MNDYKRYWIAHVSSTNGFDYPIFIYGTDADFREYCESEIGYVPRYSGATDKEVEAGKLLRMKFYLAPEARHANG